ncbi:MAG: hypothetical protein WAN65_00340, partial [Candidatus Sulfotelmatobacter sp.]
QKFRRAVNTARREREIAANRAYAKQHRLEISERKSRRKQKGAYAAAARSAKIAEALATASLDEIERPTYRIESAAGTVYTESWPLHDAAALWLAQHTPESPAGDTEKKRAGVPISMDTSAVSA